MKKWVTLFLVIGLISPAFAADSDDLLLYGPTQEIIEEEDIEDILEKLKDIMWPWPFPVGPVVMLQ